MTASKVTQVNLYSTVASGIGQTQSVQTDEFSKIFDSQAAETGNKTRTDQTEAVEQKEKAEDKFTTNEEPVVNDTQEKEPTGEAQEVSETDESKTEGLQTNGTEVSEDEENTEVMMEAVVELLATIQEVLGVSMEEVQSALDTLGISAKELLNTENIPGLVIALTEGADELSVMTNENLFADVQEITAKAENLLNELSEKTNLSLQEVKDMIQNPVQEQPPVEEEVQVVPTDKSTETPVLEENRVQVPIEVEKTQDSKNTEDGGQKNSTAGNEQMTFAQTVAEQVERAVAKTETSYSTFSAATTENIMNQIQDGIHIIRTEDITEMELHLNPESLGRVNVSVAAKEGVITATFTTENEVVRAALESQMITLKQNFEAQGIRVEAVEVTVASHAFEHNLEGGENAESEQQSPEKKKSARRISLTDLLNGIEEEEFSDEERIIAEMMRQNGNTVDYMA